MLLNQDEPRQDMLARSANAPSRHRWPALAAEREAVNLLVAQSQAIRQRLMGIVAEAKTRLQIPAETAIDIHLATGLWFKVGDPVPVEAPKPTSETPPA